MFRVFVLLCCLVAIGDASSKDSKKGGVSGKDTSKDATKGDASGKDKTNDTSKGDGGSKGTKGGEPNKEVSEEPKKDKPEEPPKDAEPKKDKSEEPPKDKEKCTEAFKECEAASLKWQKDLGKDAERIKKLTEILGALKGDDGVAKAHENPDEMKSLVELLKGPVEKEADPQKTLREDAAKKCEEAQTACSPLTATFIFPTSLLVLAICSLGMFGRLKYQNSIRRQNCLDSSLALYQLSTS